MTQPHKHKTAYKLTNVKLTCHQNSVYKLV